MKKIILIFSLIVIAISLYKHNQNNNPFPQFTDEQIQFICVEEGLECQNTF